MIGAKARPGVLLLEVLLGIAVFLLFLGAVGLVLLNGEESTKAAGDRVRAAEHAKQALEAARSIRAASFASLTPGTHGVRVNSATGKWELFGAQTPGSGGYTTTLTIAAVAADQVMLIAKTTWNISPARVGTVTLSTVLTDWEKSVQTGKWSNFVLSGSYVHAGTPLFNDIAIAGSYAYVTSEVSSGGAGLYIFDIANPTAPSLAATQDIGSARYGNVVRGATLYVLTGDAAGELKAYDIGANPTSPALLASYDLPGSGQAKAVFIDGNRLLVGATGLGPQAWAPFPWRAVSRALAAAPGSTCYDSSGNQSSCGEVCYDEWGGQIACSSSSSAAASSTPPPTGNDLFGFDISNPNVLAYKGSLYIEGVNGISLTGTSAYLASPLDTAELRVANVKNLASMSIAGSHNLSDRTLDGLSTATAKTYLLLGTDRGTAVQEVTLFDISGGGPPVGGPWYYEGSGAVVKVAMDATACYGFVAADSGRRTMHVVKVRDFSLQQLQTWDAPLPSNSGARGMHYDAAQDRLYLVNKRGFYIFSPQRGVANDCP